MFMIEKSHNFENFYSGRCDTLDTEAMALRDLGPGVQLFALGVSSGA